MMRGAEKEDAPCTVIFRRSWGPSSIQLFATRAQRTDSVGLEVFCLESEPGLGEVFELLVLRRDFGLDAVE